MAKQPEKIVMKSEQLNDHQKAVVIMQLWTALRQSLVEMQKLNGTQAVFDFQRTLVRGVKNGDITGMPLDQEKSAIDFVIELIQGAVSFE